MSWNINLTVATAASGGDIPISNATITWIDGGTSHSINNSSAFSPSNEAGTVTVSVNQASTNFTATCTGFSPQTLGGNSSTGSLLFQLAATGGGGTTGCFIATAAYGSDSAPEVKFLQDFRDNVLRRTRWGHKFFQELWKHYYHISHPISQEMDRDPELRRVIRWAIVDPWLNYIKLMMSRPDFKALNLDGLDPKLRAEAGDHAGMEANLAALRSRHEEACRDLLPEAKQAGVLTKIGKLIGEFERIVNGMAMLGERPPRSVDEAVTVGERLSVVLVSEFLRASGTPSVGVNARDVMVTDAVFGNASPLMEPTRVKARHKLLPLLERGTLPVVTGFNGARRS